MLSYNLKGSTTAGIPFLPDFYLRLILLILFFPFIIFMNSGCRPVRPLAFPQPDPNQLSASRLVYFAKTGQADTLPALVEVLVRDQEKDEPVQSATVVLQRLQSDLQYGQLTGEDGRCRFAATASRYSMRIQYTGLITFYRSNLNFQPGGRYRMEISMASSTSATAATMPLKPASASATGKPWFRRRGRGN